MTYQKLKQIAEQVKASLFDDDEYFWDRFTNIVRIAAMEAGLTSDICEFDTVSNRR